MGNIPDSRSVQLADVAPRLRKIKRQRNERLRAERNALIPAERRELDRLELSPNPGLGSVGVLLNLCSSAEARRANGLIDARWKRAQALRRRAVRRLQMRAG